MLRPLTTAVLGAGLSVLMIQAALAIDVVFVPPGGSAPSGTRGGGSRGACLGDQQMIAIAPPISNRLTTASHPSIFIYIPPSTTHQAKFSLKDASENSKLQKTIYKADLVIPIEGGVFRVDIPKNVPELQINQDYIWTLSVICEPGKLEGNPFVKSRIRRVMPPTTLATALEKAPPLERAALYGANGLWYDTLATLASLRQQNPQDSSLASSWTGFLKSAGLQEDIATKPFIGVASSFNIQVVSSQQSVPE